MSQQRDVIEQKQGNHIVRINGDSETNLDDLFKAVMQPKANQAHHGVPMRMRNLPPSFFQQPDRDCKSASHSRESSTDNTFSNSPSQPVNQNNNPASTTASNVSRSSNNAIRSPPPQHPGGLPINHPRAHSSPASLQQTYNNNAGQHQHLRQQSYDITDTIPLPQGWEMAKTSLGQRYFLNHATQTTTWEDPRKKLSAGSLSNSSGITCSSPSTSPASSLLNLQNLVPLPDGWEQATTAEGEVYFINHKTRTTSWYDPRIQSLTVLAAMHMQQPPVVPVMGAQSTNVAGQPQIPGAVAAGTTPLPPLSSTQALQQQQQKLRLQRLQMEREALRIRQQEIMSQASYFANPMLNDIMTGRSLREKNSQPTSPANNDMAPANIDPFLGADSDFHSRQESGDSGLGLSANYIRPNTPEDYLMSMEEGAEDVLLDIAELNLEPISGTLDMVPENMDSEDLEPSLQAALNEEILLGDVQDLLNKDNALKWL